MVFNSFIFILFFTAFFFTYWFIVNCNLKAQNLFILFSSYVFYAWWDWRFLLLLIGSTFINYLIGIQIGKTNNEKHRIYWLIIGLIEGIGLLVFFKYFNFFISSFIELFSLFDVHLNVQTLKIILPIGISFYTFKTISYLIDIDNEKIEPTKNWVVFSAYISFFPSLLAGPIDRANTFIPQLEKKREFQHSQMVLGLKQILWGLFKKLVIADNCNTITNNIFSNYQNLPASSLLLGAFFYIIQLYADFSGYSDMAIGFSRLIGFNLTKNFNYPFFAKNISEFWQRWHISLTSWMTEYVFTPLTFKFRKLKKTGLIIAIIINFIIVGLWHGANFTYLLFGFIQGCLFIPLILKETLNNKKTQVNDHFLPSFSEFLNMTGTFILVMFSAILLRAESIDQAFHFYAGICNKSLLSIPLLPNYKTISLTTLVFIIIMFLIEWFGQNQDFAIEKTGNNWSRNKRWLFYSLLIFVIGVFMHTEETAFIYFQF